MTIRNGDVFFVIKSDTKPEDIPGLIKGRRKNPDKELHIIIFVDEKGELILDGKPADPKVLETIIQVDTKKDVKQLFCEEEGKGKGKKSSPKKKGASSKGKEHNYGVLETIQNGKPVKVNNTGNNWKEGWCIGKCKYDAKSKLNYCTTKKQCVQDIRKPRGQDCINSPTKFGICEKRLVYKEGEQVDIPTLDFSNSYLDDLAKKHKPPFKIVDNPGGGNCFFYAIADSLKTINQPVLKKYIEYFKKVKPELGASFEKIITQPDSYKYVKEFYIMCLNHFNDTKNNIYLLHAILLAMELNTNDGDSTLKGIAIRHNSNPNKQRLVHVGTINIQDRNLSDNSVLNLKHKGFCHRLNQEYFKNYLEKESNWGGNVEAFIFSLIIQIPIDIYQVLTKGDKQILSTQNTNIYGDMYHKFGKSITELKTIDKGKFRLSILLEHSHYQSLQVISAKTGARKKKSIKRKLIDLSHIVNKNMSKKKKVQKKKNQKKQEKQEKQKKNKKKTKKSK